MIAMATNHEAHETSHASTTKIATMMETMVTVAGPRKYSQCGLRSTLMTSPALSSLVG